MACTPPRFAYARDHAFITSATDSGSGGSTATSFVGFPAPVTATSLSQSPARAMHTVGVPPPASIPGMPGYVFARTIGSGSTATVHLYHNPAAGERVALKIPSDPHDAHACRRLRGEAEALRRLAGQPFVLPLLATVELEGGAPGLVLAYATSGSYRERMTQAPMPVDEVLSLGIRLAEALHAAHRAGILHRDVKPANVLVMADGMPALSDFDVAADVYSPSVPTGHSRPWAAPEVVSGRSGGTEASDVYALAATLYGLLAGMPPPGSVDSDAGVGECPVVSGTDGGSLFTAGSGSPPMPDGVPEPLAPVLAWALAADPDERCRSAMEFHRALIRVRDDWEESGNRLASTLVDSDAERMRQVRHSQLPPAQPGIEARAASRRSMNASMPACAGTTSHRNASAPLRGRDGRVARTGPVTVFMYVMVLPIALTLVWCPVTPPVASPVSGFPAFSTQQEGSAEGLTDAPPAVVEYVPSVAGLSGREENGTVTFTWTNPDPQTGDTYAWSPVDKAGMALAAADITDRERTDVAADGTGTCIRVDLVRESGAMSSTPAIACVTAGTDDDGHARAYGREGESS